MFQPHNPDATATAIIAGLAVAKYNLDKAQWNVNLLRINGHFPRLSVNQIDRKTGQSTNVLKREIAEGDSIQITVSDPTGKDGWKFETGKFDRKDVTHDSQDLRWMLDINQLSDAPVDRLTPGVPTNPLTISDGCFYTSYRTKSDYETQWVDSKGVPSPMEFLGLIGQNFGCDFQGSSVTIEIAGADPYKATYENSAAIRFELFFDNACRDLETPENGQTDFCYYYEYFSGADGHAELFPEAKPDVVAFQMDPDPDDPGPDGPYGDDPIPDDPKSPACCGLLDNDS